MEVDCLVVGLGPAGARAAAAAAQHGLRVLAIERRSVIGEPVQCAEFIPTPLSGLAQAEGVMQHRITGMQSVLPSGTVVHNDFPGLIIDRGAFDRHLAAQAQAQGATLWTQTRLLALDPQQQIASLRRGQSTPADDLINVKYQRLIAADGPHSTCAARLGLPTLQCVRSRQYRVDLHRPLQDTWIWLDNAYPGGYAWLFPRGRVANLGLGLEPTLGVTPKTALDTLHRQLIEQGWVGATIHQRTGGAIPVGGLRSCLTHGATLFAGDAAGLTHPITGAGIAAAVQSGHAAGLAVAASLNGDPDALEDYATDMREQFAPSLERAVAHRQAMRPEWSRPPSQQDSWHRRGWIAFPEYFAPLSPIEQPTHLEPALEAV